MGRDTLRPFDFNNAFGETTNEVWGVWVGEHGFLEAVFRSQWDARNYADNLPFNDWQIDKISTIFLDKR